MKTYIVFLLLVTFALVTYVVVLPQLDSFKVWPSRNYGTLPTFIIINSAGKYETISGLQSFSGFEEKISLMQ